MSHNLTAAPASPAGALTGVLVPDSGDARTAASVTTPIQTVVNMIAYLWGMLTGTITQNLTILGTITSGQIISAGLTTSGSTDINGARDVNAGRNLNAAAAVTASTDLIAIRDCSVARNLTAATLSGRKIASMVQGGNADASYSAATYDQVWVPSGVLSTARTYAVDTTGSVDGSTITFTNLDPSHNIFVSIPGASSPVTSITINGTAGNHSSVKVRRFSSTIWGIVGGNTV